MFSVLLMVVIGLALVFLLLAVLLSYFYGGAVFSKSSGFECGFYPFAMSGISFSMPFFVVSLMFLLFDVEIVIMCFPSIYGSIFSVVFWLVILLVFLATCYEWMMGVLEWMFSF